MKKTNIDLARIFAALLVLSIHISFKCGYSFDVGRKGVPLFFILSGYLGASHLEKDPRVLRYYINRCKAILPTFYLCLLIRYVYDAVKSIVFNSASINSVFSCGGVNGLQYLRYVFMIHCLIPSSDWSKWNNRNALWSMSSFALFYLLAPWAYRLMKNLYWCIALTIIAMVATPYLAQAITSLCTGFPVSAEIDNFARYAAYTNLYAFLLGILVFVVIRENKAHYLFFCILIFLILTSFSLYSHELMFTILLIFLVEAPQLIRHNALSRVIGISRNAMFSLYLFHPMVLESFSLTLGNNAKLSTKIFYALFLYTLCIGVSMFVYFALVKRIQLIVNSRTDK